jgi:glycosyltransferase involved in cell wall biosynthesis
LYRDCAFLVMPSRREGFGLVFLEAMSAGRACVGAPGSAAEIIDAGTTGLIVNPDAAQDVAEAMATLFVDPDQRRRFGLAGCARARALFGRDRFVDALRALLQDSLHPC